MSKKAIGMTNLHRAPFTVISGVTTYSTPVRIFDLEEMKVKDKYADGSNYADNMMNIYASKVTGADIDATLTLLLQADEAALTGKNYDDGEIETTANDVQKGSALLYQVNYSDGSYENKIYYNCRLRREDYSGKTTAEKLDYTAATLTGMALPLPNGKLSYTIASDALGTDTEGLKKKKLDNFFKTVQFKDVPDPTADTITVLYSAYTTGTVDTISIVGATFNTSTKTFSNVPSATTTFTFKVASTTVTATKSGSTWSFV